MKTSFPLNSMPAASVTGNVGFHSASAATNEVAATVMNAIKQCLLSHAGRGTSRRDTVRMDNCRSSG